jgi:hypothetical protein
MWDEALDLVNWDADDCKFDVINDSKKCEIINLK